jgi:hypothetical protein
LRRDTLGKATASGSEDDDSDRDEDCCPEHVEDPDRRLRSSSGAKQKAQELVDPVTYPLYEAVQQGRRAAQGVVPRHGQHVVEPLLRKLGVLSVGRLFEQSQQSEQTRFRVDQVRGLSLKVVEYLRLGQAGAGPEHGSCLVRGNGVAGCGAANHLVSAVDRLLVARGWWRFG